VVSQILHSNWPRCLEKNHSSTWKHALTIAVYLLTQAGQLVITW